jgi:hypothetical protein
VIKKKKKINDFLDEFFKLFSGFTKQKNNFRRSAVGRLLKIVVRAITFFPFNLETSSSQVRNILVFLGAYCFFNHFDELVRVAPDGFFLSF